MADYRPPQRVIPARILTPTGWIQGHFHVPRLHSFLDFVAQPSPFFNLTDVTVPRAPEPLAFLALRRSAARVVLPTCDERRLFLRDPPNASVRAVTCLLEAGAVSGRLAIPPHLRVSDYLAHHAGFLQLRGVTLGFADAHAGVAFLNASALIAVSDARAAAEERGASVPVEVAAPDDVPLHAIAAPRR